MCPIRCCACMGKPRARGLSSSFVEKYQKLNEQVGHEAVRRALPHVLASRLHACRRRWTLAEYLRDTGHEPEQVQDFYPTPSTLSTVMYYTGLDPRTMEPVYVPRNPHEKAMQRALMQYRRPQNYFACARSPAEGRAHRPHRLHAQMSHPPVSAEGEESRRAEGSAVRTRTGKAEAAQIVYLPVSSHIVFHTKKR